MIRWTWPNWITVGLMGLTLYVGVIALMSIAGGPSEDDDGGIDVSESAEVSA